MNFDAIALARIQVRIGQRLMQERGIEVPELDIMTLIPKLAPTKMVKGRKTEKTYARLHQEAKLKLTYKLARSVAPRWSLYALRHTWATNALQRNVDPLSVAILMGHSDPSTLTKVYQHVALNPAHMLQQAKRAVTSASGESA